MKFGCNRVSSRYPHTYVMMVVMQMVFKLSHTNFALCRRSQIRSAHRLCMTKDFVVCVFKMSFSLLVSIFENFKTDETSYMEFSESATIK